MIAAAAVFYCCLNDDRKTSSLELLLAAFWFIVNVVDAGWAAIRDCRVSEMGQETQQSKFGASRDSCFFGTVEQTVKPFEVSIIKSIMKDRTNNKLNYL